MGLERTKFNKFLTDAMEEFNEKTKGLIVSNIQVVQDLENLYYCIVYLEEDVTTM